MTPTNLNFKCEKNFFVFEIESLDNKFAVTQKKASCAKCKDINCENCFDAFSSSCLCKLNFLNNF